MKAIKPIGSCFIFCLALATCIGQTKMTIKKKETLVPVENTQKLTDISDHFTLQSVNVKMLCSNMSPNASAEYNLGIDWRAGIPTKGTNVCTFLKGWYNNNQLPSHQKNSIYIYTPTTATLAMVMNKNNTFSLKEFKQTGGAKRGTFQILVFGYAKPNVKEIWKTAFVVQFCFTDGKTKVYKYLKIPEKVYTIGDTAWTHVDFDITDLQSGSSNFPEDPATAIPQIK